MLSEAERRRLDEMGQLLIREDPLLAEACREMNLPATVRKRSQILIVTCGVLAMIMMISSALVAEPALAALGLLLAGVAGLEIWRHPAPRPASPPA